MSKTSDEARQEILDYYKARATTGFYATSPDFNLREIEIEYLQKNLRNNIRVLDVGCGNGYSTLCHAAAYESDFTGIDFVPEMIDAAKELEEQFTLKGKIAFEVGDATQLQFQNESFDVIISERCLLNLPTKENQWQAIREIARALKPGGQYLMLEGTIQGLQRLNEVRALFNLDPVPEAASGYNWFSNKFDEEEMLKVANGIFAELVGIQRFGMYYFISRVLHPLIISPDQPKYDAKINEVARHICSQIPDYNNMGHVALFIFRK